MVHAQGGVIAAIKQALGEAHIDLPFPTRVVLLHDQTEETDGDRSRQREGWPAGETPPRPRHLNSIMFSAARHARIDSSATADAERRVPIPQPPEAD